MKPIWMFGLTELAHALLFQNLPLETLYLIYLFVDLYTEVLVPDSLLVQLSNKGSHMLVVGSVLLFVKVECCRAPLR